MLCNACCTINEELVTPIISLASISHGKENSKEDSQEGGEESEEDRQESCSQE